jgi:Mg2+-importing ATPase
MFVFGPISSLFDILTFIILYNGFHLHEAGFQAGWFIESLATQTFVIYIIRTRKIPFFKSKPSKYLILSSIGALSVGVLLTMPFIGKVFGFALLPLRVFATIAGLVVVYLVLVEIAKHFFYQRFARREG